MWEVDPLILALTISKGTPEPFPPALPPTYLSCSAQTSCSQALTVAFEAIPHPAWLAPAAETPRDVEAGSVVVTAVSPKLTFIHI